jgi:hypothetical protein
MGGGDAMFIAFETEKAPYLTAPYEEAVQGSGLRGKSTGCRVCVLRFRERPRVDASDAQDRDR